MDYVVDEGTIEVPKGAGIEGFLRAIREVLRLPRIQEVRIDNRGKVTFTYFKRERDRSSPSLDIDFSSDMPYALVRQSEVTEHIPTSSHAAAVLGELFAAAARDHLFPVAWVSGPESRCWRWYEEATGLSTRAAGDLLGLEFKTDPLVENDVLLLCAAFGRGASFAETQKTYKLVIPDPRIP